MEYLRAFNSLLFPNRNFCYFCKDKTYDLIDYLCLNCRDNIEIVNKKIILDSAYIEEVYYVSIYNKFMRKLIQDYKFHGKSYLYKPLGAIMIENLKMLEVERDIDLICYIPSHRRKEAKRGYNQGELLASHIAKNTGLNLSHKNLIKIRNTKEQNKLNQLERIGNLRDSFRVKNKEEIKDKNILLVDDIITTGSTMIEVSKVLKEAGAGTILGLALTSSHIL